MNGNALSGAIANGFLRETAGGFVTSATISQIMSGLMNADFNAQSTLDLDVSASEELASEVAFAPLQQCPKL